MGRLLMAVLTVLLGGLLAATLVRFAPGFGIDVHQLDTRLDQESVEARGQARAGERNILAFYWGYLTRAARGDLGMSHALGRPVAELVRERLPVTLRWVGLGWVAGWVLALLLAFSAALLRHPAFDVIATALSGVFLSLPSALLALVFLFFEGPGPLAIGFVVFPQVFRYVRNILSETSAQSHVLTARAKGVGDVRILLCHVCPCAAPQLLALLGVSAAMAFGASIPIEVICDSPGIGQLAWEAALSRDLPLLVNLSVLVTVVTLLANAFSDVAIGWWAHS